MLMALNAKHKLGFVDGSISQPPLDDPFVGVWPRCNNIVTSWLLNVVSKEIIVVYFILTVLKPFGRSTRLVSSKQHPTYFSNQATIAWFVLRLSILFILV